MSQPLRVFIGFDHRQPVSYLTLVTSILRHTTQPISITALQINTLPLERTGLTPFTYSRFMVPWLCGYDGWALFIDCDKILRADISELFALKDDRYAIMTIDDPAYKFEWAAVMLFNCGHPENAVLTPDYVNDPARCKTPHIIDWTDCRGTIPPEWHHMVGYSPPRDDAKLVHYTMGVPAFPETEFCEYGDDWRDNNAIMNAALPWVDMMGISVHAKKVVMPDGTKRMVPKLYSQDAADAYQLAKAEKTRKASLQAPGPVEPPEEEIKPELQIATG